MIVYFCFLLYGRWRILLSLFLIALDIVLISLDVIVIYEHYHDWLINLLWLLNKVRLVRDFSRSSAGSFAQLFPTLFLIYPIFNHYFVLNHNICSLFLKIIYFLINRLTLYIMLIYLIFRIWFFIFMLSVQERNQVINSCLIWRSL